MSLICKLHFQLLRPNGNYCISQRSPKMANALCLTSSIAASFNSPAKPGVSIASDHPRAPRIDVLRRPSTKFHILKTKAADDNIQRTKSNSIVCPDCDGNGAVVCSQCKGNGVNSVDHFNGQFKAGGLCWLCRGKKDMLCGNCNGAGFVGGFMSSYDE